MKWMLYGIGVCVAGIAVELGAVLTGFLGMGVIFFGFLTWKDNG